jgi:PAS domain-containing protein
MNQYADNIAERIIMDQNQLKQTFDLLPGIWCIVDSESRYIYYNQAYALLVGLADKPEGYLYGKTVADMHCRAAECAPLFCTSLPISYIVKGLLC